MNVVFDFGGVLFRWAPHDFMPRLLPHRTATAAALQALIDDFFQGFGGDWSEFDRGAVEVDALAEAIARRTGLSVAEARRVIDAVPAELVPIPGMQALLRRLAARGHALFFLSNMPASYAEHLEATHDFLGVFKAGVFSSRVRLVKPEPAIYAHAAAAFGIDAADAVFIDDVPANVDAARAAGWRGVHFVDPEQCEAELARFGLCAEPA